MSLYLKYRPQDFNNLVGQDHITVTLANALKEDRVSQAYLFCGPRGTGKTSTARLIAKALNCADRSEQGSPCNKCDLCEQINSGRLTDIIEIDAASNRGIDEMRDLREKINFMPNIAKYKIYIIDEVHMLTKEAFNALLKTLEEPPAHAYFILATTESYKVPETIISRCQRFDFHRMSEAVLIERLKYIAQEEKIEFELEALECIASRVNGGMRDAIGLLEQSTKAEKLTLQNLQSTLGLTENQSIVDLLDAIYKSELTKSLELINTIHTQGFDLGQLSKDFLECARKQMLAAVNNGDSAKVSRTLSIIECVEEAKMKIKNSALPQLALEIAAIRLCGIAPAPISPPVVAAVQAKAPVSTGKPATPSNSDSKPESKEVAQSEDTEPEVYETTLKELESSNENDLLSKLRNNWLSVVGIIKNPVIRTSFKDAKAVSITGNILLLHFSTNFHLEKTSTSAAHSEIENAIEEKYNVKLGIKTDLRKVDLEPTIQKREHGGIDSNAPKENTEKTVEENPEEAVNVFDSW